MTQFRRLARSFMLAAAAACAFAATWVSLSSVGTAKTAPQAKQAAKDSAAADSKESQDEQKKAAARQAYDAGLKQFANGHYQPAIEQLSAALKSGGLLPQQLAKALYTRGIAYKKQKQPGLAISDLTSALWLKNGLAGKDRDTATAERAEAYQMAGIQDTGKGPERVIGVATPSGADTNSAGLSAAAIAQAAAANKNANNNSSTGSPVDSLAASTVTAGGAPAAAPASQSSSFGSGVTGFFSNWFGGGSSSGAPASGPAPAGVTTASTSPPAPEVSSWSNATVVNHGAAAQGNSKPREEHAKTHATGGKYKIHIAALRSRAEAEALAQKIVAQHGAELDNHMPTVDEKIIGSMGTFYRVRIGGYASQDEPRGVCNKLRTSGLDCLVVTN